MALFKKKKKKKFCFPFSFWIRSDAWILEKTGDDRFHQHNQEKEVEMYSVIKGKCLEKAIS